MIEKQQLPLKSLSQRRSLVGQHIDFVLALTSKNGYAADIFYDKIPKKSLGRKTLAIEVDDKNIVRKVR